MKQEIIIGRAQLPRHTQCSVSYYKNIDFVEVSVGNTSLKLEANSFILLNEMMRKAAAKIIMRIPTSTDI
jgi:hypothetical protein